MTLLDAIRRDLAGRQKSVAMEVWPNVSQATAESRMSRTLSGELALPPKLVAAAVKGGAGATLEHLRVIAEGDPSELRRQAIRLIHEGQVQMAFAFEALERADEAERAERERKGPIRVGEPARETRRRA